MNKEKHPVLRKVRRILRILILCYLLAALVPCFLLPPYPVKSTESWPQTSRNVDMAALVEGGGDSLQLRLGLIQSAQKSIRLGTYLFGVDGSGTEIMAALYQAAERGVQVEILTDGLLGVLNFRNDPLVYALGSHERVTIYLYNPVDLLLPWNLNSRYHEKYMVVDDETLLLGGRNVSDEFLLEGTEGYSLDLEVLTVKSGDGVCAANLAAQRFDDMVHGAFCEAAYGSLRNDSDRSARETLRMYSVRPGILPGSLSLVPIERAMLFGTAPDPSDKTPDVMGAMSRLADRAQEEVIWCSPYFCLDAPMKASLSHVADEKQVRLITNSAATGNNVVASADGVFHRSMVNRLPCEVWEVQSVYSLHTKAMLLDRRTSVIGSFNMDMRSCYLDTELMIALDSPELAQRTLSYLGGLMDTSAPASEMARATGKGMERAEMPLRKGVMIYLMSPIISLFRFLV